MGKKSKSKGREEKKPLSSTSSSSRSARMEQVAALLAANKEQFSILFQCTNGDLLRSVRAFQNMSRRPEKLSGRPTTGSGLRTYQDQALDFFDVAHLIGEDQMTDLYLTSFRDYVANTILIIKGHANEKFRKNFQEWAGSDAFNSCIPFPDTIKSGVATETPVTDRDKKFLKRVLKMNEVGIFTAHAALALGFWYKFVDDNVEKGLFMFQTSVRACDAVSASDKTQALPLKPIPTIDGKSIRCDTVGHYLAYVRDHAEVQVKVCREVRRRMTNNDENVYIPGERCDGCGKPEQDKPLLKCTRCQCTYYCSRECQVAHWKRGQNGHKAECRKKGEFRVGDQAKTLQSFGITPKGLTVVLLEKREGSKWLVTSLYDDDKCELSEEFLRLLAPSEKRLRDAMDKVMYGRTFH